MLDEATGALDARSESGILSALRSRLPQTALVVVSHRTGLAAIADQCLVIDGRGVATAVRRDHAEPAAGPAALKPGMRARSEEHTSELQSLMRISYAVFCLKKKNEQQTNHQYQLQS